MISWFFDYFHMMHSYTDYRDTYRVLPTPPRVLQQLPGRVLMQHWVSQEHVWLLALVGTLLEARYTQCVISADLTAGAIQAFLSENKINYCSIFPQASNPAHQLSPSASRPLPSRNLYLPPSPSPSFYVLCPAPSTHHMPPALLA